MQWTKTDMDFTFMRTVEESVLQACKIDKDYYNKYRERRRSEIILVKQIACHYLCENTLYSTSTIGLFLGIERSTLIYHRKRCKELLDVDKNFANIYKEGSDIIASKLAKMRDNY